MTGSSVGTDPRHSGARREEVTDALNAIVDACSVAAGLPIGLVDMGIAHVLSIEDARVTVRMTPTFGGCLFVGVFSEEIEKRLLELEWCSEVKVDVVEFDGIWTEDKISGPARERLERRRARLRAELATRRERTGNEPAPRRAPPAARRISVTPPGGA
jgi:metal-sulfur cluster biosynthetic enzyme